MWPLKGILRSVGILLIFIFGYLLGKIGLDNLIDSMIEKLSKLDYLTLIGLISSLITVALFISYIVGKIFLIKQMELTLFEKFDLKYHLETESDIQYGNYEIVESLNIGEYNNEAIYITPSQPLRYLSIYEFDAVKLKKGELIETIGPIANGHTVQLNTYLNCGMPSFTIEFQRFDFVKGTLDLAENGKTGVVSQNLVLNHTIKSYLYYLVK